MVGVVGGKDRRCKMMKGEREVGGGYVWLVCIPRVRTLIPVCNEGCPTMGKRWEQK